MKSIMAKAWALTVLLPLVGWVLADWRFALSVLVGALLMVLNIRWMTLGVDRLLGRPSPRSDASVVMLFWLRLVLIFIALFAMIRVSFLSPTGALLGLSVFVLAGMTEAVWLLVKRGEPKQ